MTTLSESLVQPRQQNPPATPELAPSAQRKVNVGFNERLITGALGGILVLRTVTGRGGLLSGLLGGAMLYRSSTGYCPVYQSLGMNRAHGGPATAEDYFTRSIHAEAAITIDKPADELFGFWRNFENLPRFMRHLEAVSVTSERTSHWRAKAPAGSSVEWEAEIINEEPETLIAWRSLENAGVDNAGSVRFIPAPEGRGTEVRVVLDYIPPAGRLGSAVAKLFGEEPQQQVRDDLRRFKQLMETGQVPSIEGQPQGTCC
jgi:uncharacterized membrane protein